ARRRGRTHTRTRAHTLGRTRARTRAHARAHALARTRARTREGGRARAGSFRAPGVRAASTSSGENFPGRVFLTCRVERRSWIFLGVRCGEAQGEESFRKN